MKVARFAKRTEPHSVLYIAPFASSRITLILSDAHTTFNFEIMEIVFEIVTAWKRIPSETSRRLRRLNFSFLSEFQSTPSSGCFYNETECHLVAGTSTTENGHVRTDKVGQSCPSPYKTSTCSSVDMSSSSKRKQTQPIESEIIPTKN
jgi:hypothetical protein